MKSSTTKCIREKLSRWEVKEMVEQLSIRQAETLVIRNIVLAADHVDSNPANADSARVALRDAEECYERGIKDPDQFRYAAARAAVSLAYSRSVFSEEYRIAAERRARLFRAEIV